jgi:hypothetical protein
MQANVSHNRRRWERQPAEISISLVMLAENLMVDSSAVIVDFSLRGVRVLTTLELAQRERVRIVANGEPPDAIPALVAWVRDGGDESSHWRYAGLEFSDR